MSEIKNILLDMMPDFEDFLSFPALLLISCNTFLNLSLLLCKMKLLKPD